MVITAVSLIMSGSSRFLSLTYLIFGLGPDTGGSVPLLFQEMIGGPGIFRALTRMPRPPVGFSRGFFIMLVINVLTSVTWEHHPHGLSNNIETFFSPRMVRLLLRNIVTLGNGSIHARGYPTSRSFANRRHSTTYGRPVSMTVRNTIISVRVVVFPSVISMPRTPTQPFHTRIT